jgi:hypothetical protein
MRDLLHRIVLGARREADVPTQQERHPVRHSVLRVGFVRPATGH